MFVPELPVATFEVVPVLVMAEVPIGLVVVQENGMVHELDPEVMRHEVVLEVNVPEGAAATVILILSVAVPPRPVQETEYVVFDERAGVVNDPVVPVPEVLTEEQAVALVDVQEIVVVPLYPMEELEAVTFTVGSGMRVKLAVILLLASMVTETGLVELVILPDQLLNL